ncbi:MAG: hypothetical protein JWQ81_4093 [Amycolatopsis sp.]|nr:hypothetical protein [Amycolatopsis sp.]
MSLRPRCRTFRKLAQALVFLCACLLVTSAPAYGGTNAKAVPAATPFKVLALYNGTYDPAHIAYDNEAKTWFPQQGAANGYTFTASTNWDLLNNITTSQYQVVMFLDDAPHSASQRSGFQTYMQNGGGWFGFHVSAFVGNASDWDWYYNQFLGSGAFASNTWGPTTAVLKVEDRNHPSTAGLPATYTSAVSEWYSWAHDLRTNPNIDILTSVDPSSFPLGSDPNQQWHSGYYPIMWSNKNYKMIYANFGHDAMDYPNNIPLSSTFASAQQNQFILNGLKWLGGAGGSTTPPPPGPISATAWYAVADSASGKCIDARSAASVNGTAIQQYTCNSTQAQQYQFQSTDSGYVRINNRINAAQVVDVSNVSTADNAPVQLWAYGNGNNQQWKPVAETSGAYHFVNRNSSKCLTVPGASTADSVQLVQLTCNGSASQSFSLTQQP